MQVRTRFPPAEGRHLQVSCRPHSGNDVAGHIHTVLSLVRNYLDTQNHIKQ